MADAGVGWGELLSAGGVVLTGAWGLIKLIVGPHVNRLDEHDKDIAKLKADGVTKDDLEKASTTIISAVREMKNDLVTQINVAQRAADTAHERIDRDQQAELGRLRAEQHRNSG